LLKGLPLGLPPLAFASILASSSFQLRKDIRLPRAAGVKTMGVPVEMEESDEGDMKQGAVVHVPE